MRYLDCGCAIRDDGTRFLCPTCESPPARVVCRWTRDEDDTWFSGCGEAFVFTDGTPRENKYAYCPYCGRTLEQVDEIMGAAEKYHCPDCKHEWLTQTRRTWLCEKCKRPGIPGPLPNAPALGERSDTQKPVVGLSGLEDR